MTISLNSLSGKFLTSISLKFFFFFFEFVWFFCLEHISVSLFCLTLYVFNSMYYVKQESYLSQSWRGGHRKGRVCLGCCVLGVVDCQEWSLQLFHSCGAQKHKPSSHQDWVFKGCPLCGLCTPAEFCVSGQPGNAEVGQMAVVRQRKSAKMVPVRASAWKVEGECENGSC